MCGWHRDVLASLRLYHELKTNKLPKTIITYKTGTSTDAIVE